ncbi:glycoside hydrolase family 72 protein [Mycena sp. CBHHK59/15]|nr:glycoside hydrolase family 72 protein [Mycena sp. CBHHK59/15]
MVCDFLVLATTLLALATATGAISKVSRTGKYLYTDDGNRFHIKGIAYQTQGLVIPGPNNPLNQPSTFVDQLADDAACTRDLPLFKKLGINAIRAYSVNSALNHDSCMSALSGAGIYVIIDLTLPLNGSIDTTQPVWSTNIQDQYINTVNAFSKYDNVLAYNVGNEVLTAGAINAAPFIKAAARDMKAYLTSISSSALVGYADIDGASNFRDVVADYLSCDPSGSNSGSTSIDIFGLNNYEWCGNAANTSFNAVNAEFADYNVVAYFSEFGSENCNPNPRIWTEVATLFSAPMTDVWSGGVAFSYFSALSRGHEFGMVTLSADNTTVTTNGDFENLVSEYNKVTFVNSPGKSSVSDSSFPPCPASSVTWAVGNTTASWTVSSTLPPTPNEAACNCVESQLSCRFRPSTTDYNVVVGVLFGQACGLLINDGGSCDDVSSDGIKGVYGHMSMCNPTTRLSYVFSQYYELNNREATACSFAGNGSINFAMTTSTMPAAAVASSCIADPSAVAIPTLGSGGTLPSGSNAALAPSSSSGSKGAAGSLRGGNALFCAAMMAACIVGSALWTLS